MQIPIFLLCTNIDPTPGPFLHSASLYELDQEGLKRLIAFQMGQEDQEWFDEWVEAQKLYTYYGATEEVACEEAFHQAIRNGWFVLNYPEGSFSHGHIFALLELSERMNYVKSDG